MRELIFALQSAENIVDPRQRTLTLVGAAAKHTQVISLLSQILDQAYQSAMAIPDPKQRTEALAVVEKAMMKLGYDPTLKTFQAPISNVK